MDETDTMVNSDDVTPSDQIDVAHEKPGRADITSLNSEFSDTPEYATITSRLRQHDPPVYLNHKSDSSPSRKDNTDEETERQDNKPEDDASIKRLKAEEDKIEELDSLLEEPKEPSANGYPPGVGWTIGVGPSMTVAAFGSNDHIDASKAERNSKILKNFEDPPKDKDECLVDCLYYTTTCCECTIL